MAIINKAPFCAAALHFKHIVWPGWAIIFVLHNPSSRGGAWKSKYCVPLSKRVNNEEPIWFSKQIPEFNLGKQTVAHYIANFSSS